MAYISKSLVSILVVLMMVQSSVGHFTVGKRGRLREKQILKDGWARELRARIANNIEMEAIRNARGALKDISQKLENIENENRRAVEKDYERLLNKNDFSKRNVELMGLLMRKRRQEKRK